MTRVPPCLKEGEYLALQRLALQPLMFRNVMVVGFVVGFEGPHSWQHYACGTMQQSTVDPVGNQGVMEGAGLLVGCGLPCLVPLPCTLKDEIKVPPTAREQATPSPWSLVSLPGTGTARPTTQCGPRSPQA